jgi:hypothetical protein
MDVEEFTFHSTPPPSRYAPAGVHVRAVGWFVVGFFVTGAVLLAVVFWMQGWIEGRDKPADTRIEALEVDQPLQPSPAHPLLPWQDMAALRERQESALRNGGPAAGGGGGGVRIPIDRAMEQLLESGALKGSWPATQPYQLETRPYAHRAVENRT